jgi:hypothetical protein
MLPLTVEELRELLPDSLEALELDPAQYFACGHRRSPANTYVERAGRRRCLTCKRAWRQAA